MLRFLNSSAFRLTLLYMLMFGASVAVLLSFIYYNVVRETERQFKHDINVQLADLGRKFLRDGPYETAAQIEHLLDKDNDRTLVLLLIDPNWNIMAGNLEVWPGGKIKPADWIHIDMPPDGDRRTVHQAIAINSSLPGDYILLVGRKLTSLLRIRRVIADVLYICMGITGVLAAAGGVLLTLVIQRRIETVNETCRRVMSGELETRVKVSGSGDEFDALAENLNAMLNRICELIDGVRDISYSVAHDLRTPLTRVRNRLEAIAHSGMPKEQMIEEIGPALAELDGLVSTFNAILRIAQAEMGAAIEQFEPFDLSAVIASVVELYRPLAEDKQLSLQVALDEHIQLKGEKHLMAQACANLLDNAIKYTPPGGEITVALVQEEEMVALQVCDNGLGIPPEQYGKVTEKFYRLEVSRTTPGNGLGLSLVQAAVRLHGGNLEFEDNRPGLKVTARLPL